MIRAGVLVLQLLTAQAARAGPPAPRPPPEAAPLPPDADALYKLGVAFLARASRRRR